MDSNDTNPMTCTNSVEAKIICCIRTLGLKCEPHPWIVAPGRDGAIDDQSRGEGEDMIADSPSKSCRLRRHFCVGAGQLLLMVVKLVMLLITLHTHAD